MIVEETPGNEDTRSLEKINIEKERERGDRDRKGKRKKKKKRKMEEFKYRNGEEKGQEPNAGKSPCSQGSPCQYISITVLVQSSSMSISTFSCDRPVRLICGFYYKIQEVPGTYFTGLY